MNGGPSARTETPMDRPRRHDPELFEHLYRYESGSQVPPPPLTLDELLEHQERPERDSAPELG